MNEKDWERKLREEGFNQIFVWGDGPNVSYPDHTHAETTAHIILDGEMTLTVEGKTQTFKAGERIDVPARTVHSAKWAREDASTWWGKNSRVCSPDQPLREVYRLGKASTRWVL